VALPHHAAHTSGRGTMAIVSSLAVDVGKTSIARYHIKDHLAAFKFKPEVEFAQTCMPQSFPQPGFVFLTIKHQETAAARARDFAPDCAVPLRQFIPVINLTVSDAIGESFLGFPIQVEELAEKPQVAGHYGVPDLNSYVLYFVQASQNFSIFILSRSILFLQNGGGISGCAGVEQQNIAFQFFNQFHTQCRPYHLYLSVFCNLKRDQASKCGHVLVLLANRLLQQFEFDVTGFLRNILVS
jgi:hypothetical protein